MRSIIYVDVFFFRYGFNTSPTVRVKGFCKIFMENFDDKINQILLVAAIVSIVIGLITEGFPEGMVDGVSIGFALIIVTVVGSYNNWVAENKLGKLILISNM